MNKAGGNGGKIRAVEFVFRWEYFLFRMQIPMNIVREPYLIPRSSSFFFLERLKIYFSISEFIFRLFVKRKD